MTVEPSNRPEKRRAGAPKPVPRQRADAGAKKPRQRAGAGAKPAPRLELNGTYRLYQHQKTALARMRELEQDSAGAICGGFLFLEMGMGKTLLALYHTFADAAEKRGGAPPTLIIAPKSVIGSAWRADGVEKFFGPECQRRALYFHADFMGKPAFTATRAADFAAYDAVITSYSVVAQAWRRREKLPAAPRDKGAALLHELRWRRIICDESQRFANARSQLFQAVSNLAGEAKWCLSGTPIRNRERELWAQARFLGSSHEKKEWSALHAKIFLERRAVRMTYKSSGFVLAPKREITHTVVLGPQERRCYELIEDKMRVVIDEYRRNRVYAHVLAMFTRLRQCSLAAYTMTNDSSMAVEAQLLAYELTETAAAPCSDVARLIAEFAGARRTPAAAAAAPPEAALKEEAPYTPQEVAVSAWIGDAAGTAGRKSAKIMKIVEIVDSLRPAEKVTIFSTFSRFLDLARVALQARKHGCVQIDGRVDTETRERNFRVFRDDPAVRVILLTYSVGAVGFNLTAATHCICAEPWWNTAVTDQAKARVWRTGQEKSVTIHTLEAADTLEVRLIKEICARKTGLVDECIKDVPLLSFDAISRLVS